MDRCVWKRLCPRVRGGCVAHQASLRLPLVSCSLTQVHMTRPEEVLVPPSWGLGSLRPFHGGGGGWTFRPLISRQFPLARGPHLWLPGLSGDHLTETTRVWWEGLLGSRTKEQPLYQTCFRGPSAQESPGGGSWELGAGRRPGLYFLL